MFIKLSIVFVRFQPQYDLKILLPEWHWKFLNKFKFWTHNDHLGDNRSSHLFIINNNAIHTVRGVTNDLQTPA
jgi:hypothetical protein